MHFYQQSTKCLAQSSIVNVHSFIPLINGCVPLSRPMTRFNSELLPRVVCLNGMSIFLLDTTEAQARADTAQILCSTPCPPHPFHSLLNPLSALLPQPAGTYLLLSLAAAYPATTSPETRDVGSSSLHCPTYLS